MNEKRPKAYEYMCTYCGAKRVRGLNAGRPAPDKCAKRQHNMPHRWVVNRKVF